MEIKKDMAYHVRYLRHDRPRLGMPALEPVQETIVLRGIHPLIWASQPPAKYRETHWDEILDWREFQCSDEMWNAIEAGKILDIECGLDSRTRQF